MSLLQPLLHFTPRVANSGQELAKEREQQQYVGWSLRCAVSFGRISLSTEILAIPRGRADVAFYRTNIHWKFTLCVRTKMEKEQ